MVLRRTSRSRRATIRPRTTTQLHRGYCTQRWRAIPTSTGTLPILPTTQLALHTLVTPFLLRLRAAQRTTCVQRHRLTCMQVLELERRRRERRQLKNSARLCPSMQEGILFEPERTFVSTLPAAL